MNSSYSTYKTYEKDSRLIIRMYIYFNELCQSTVFNRRQPDSQVCVCVSFFHLMNNEIGICAQHKQKKKKCACPVHVSCYACISHAHFSCRNFCLVLFFFFAIYLSFLFVFMSKNNNAIIFFFWSSVNRKYVRFLLDRQIK